MYPTTTHTPAFLGLTKDAGLWPDSHLGKGVVIGIIDYKHPSFNDIGMSPPPARWKRACKGGWWGGGVRCNNKLIGAKSFVDNSVTDYNGHGTHVASTAAGNFVANSSIHGQAAGMAHGAQLAVYKVCNRNGCSNTAIIQAMDEAVRDGVDLLSVSLGYGTEQRPLEMDAVGIGAVTSGVVVVASAGNQGPGWSSVENDYPWQLIWCSAGAQRQRLASRPLLGRVQRPWRSDREGQASYRHVRRRRRLGWRRCPGPHLQNRSLYDNGAAQVVVVGQEKTGYSLILRDYGASMAPSCRSPPPLAARSRTTPRARSSAAAARPSSPPSPAEAPAVTITTF
jgi:hypothetical protein